MLGCCEVAPPVDAEEIKGGDQSNLAAVQQTIQGFVSMGNESNGVICFLQQGADAEDFVYTGEYKYEKHVLHTTEPKLLDPGSWFRDVPIEWGYLVETRDEALPLEERIELFEQVSLAKVAGCSWSCDLALNDQLSQFVDVLISAGPCCGVAKFTVEDSMYPKVVYFLHHVGGAVGAVGNVAHSQKFLLAVDKDAFDVNLCGEANQKDEILALIRDHLQC
jgi:hypothetical protein